MSVKRAMTMAMTMAMEGGGRADVSDGDRDQERVETLFVGLDGLLGSVVGHLVGRVWCVVCGVWSVDKGERRVLLLLLLDEDATSQRGSIGGFIQGLSVTRAGGSKQSSTIPSKASRRISWPGGIHQSDNQVRSEEIERKCERERKGRQTCTINIGTIASCSVTTFDGVSLADLPSRPILCLRGLFFDRWKDGRADRGLEIRRIR